MALSQPQLWNSVHRPINYRWTFPSYSFSNVIKVGGETRFMLPPAYVSNFAVGQRVHIDSGSPVLYAGVYTVQSLGSDYIVLNATYVSAASGQATPLSAKTVHLYAGYGSTHPAHNDNPDRLIATISAPTGIENYIDINVSGYLKGLFKKVQPPTIGPDWSMSTPFYVIIDSTTYSTRYAVNGTLEHQVLNNLSAPYEVLNVRTPIHFKDGRCLYSILRPETDPRGCHVLNVAGIHGAGNIGGLGFDAIGTTFTIG
jgi:hypothetical protein